MRAPNADSLFKEATSAPFGAVAFHEHSGSFRNAWAHLGVHAASIADRPSSTLPARDSIHFIGDVRKWHAAYSWTIPLATANPDCHVATLAVERAAKNRWLHYLRSGAMADAIYHVVWTLHSASRVALEQPPTLFEQILGEPSARTTLAAFGVPRRKDWLWWLVNLPPVRPTGPPVPEPPSEHKAHNQLDKERRSIARAETPPSFAAPRSRRSLASSPFPADPPYPRGVQGVGGGGPVDARLFRPRSPHPRRRGPDRPAYALAATRSRHLRNSDGTAAG